MPPLRPGPGKIFVRPDERHKVRDSGLLVPTIAQDDAFQGTVIAVGAGAWFGRAPREYGLRAEPAQPPDGWRRIERRMPFEPGQVVFYEPESVQVFTTGYGADEETYYALEVRDIYGWVEGGVQTSAPA